MKITNNVFEALTRIDVLSRLLSCDDLPVMASYQLAKLTKVLEEEMKVYLQEKNKILDRYCKKDDDGKFIIENNSLVVHEGMMDDFNVKMKALMDIDNEIPVERVKIKIQHIPKGYISPANFAFLENFIEFIVE
jgi:uncharacterized HAD superfamily protein